MYFNAYTHMSLKDSIHGTALYFLRAIIMPFGTLPTLTLTLIMHATLHCMLRRRGMPLEFTALWSAKR